MSDIDRLPGNWRASFQNFASASEAVRNGLLQFHPGWHTVYTNFLGDALPTEWAAGATNGTGAAVTVASSQLTLTSGTSDNGYAGQGFGLFWSGDNGHYFESEQSLDVLTTVKIEIGITDATGDAGAVNAKATPTGTADDFVVVVFDTDDNTELDIISELDDGGPAEQATDIHTLVAATDFTTSFTTQNDTTSVKIGSSFSNLLVAGSGSMQGGDNATPWFFAQSRAATASRVLTVNYMIMAGPNS